ncbi:alpha-protein kinase 3 [Brachionichthys hirsutus]|uniref:alpha-protein kinase 3 n=1 Tax=Brachionichthys hirsutus TaxID=412623 RepID=UPI00360525F1
MDSRRTLSRNSSGNGRSGNGDDFSGSGRTGGCSYISNVRPGNRNTLCSIIAQLTEETQPSFETTLKSKAVSENCNVKFSCAVSGHPVPQVIWYKDDVQLDRYCGLPKYEIFRNGQNHSLHIYNCTTEDAAIYQASAINTKGIVSCSGVLEVGEMNEFQIHQRYFAKLKQKAEIRRKEAEGKENQEPLRTISPDRAQRKRRSAMEAFLSRPSSMEEDIIEESHQAVAVETDVTMQEATVEEVKENPAPLTNGALTTLTNGQVIGENANKSVTHKYDAAQKMFTAHQPKIPFVKKKIKISNTGKVAKSDPPRERTPEGGKGKHKGSISVSLTSAESGQCEGKAEEVMEVENIVSSSSAVDSGSQNVTENQKSDKKDVSPAERCLKDGNTSMEVTTSSQKEQLSALLPSAVPASTGRNVSGTPSKHPAKHQKETKYTSRVKHLETKKQSPHLPSWQRKTSTAAASQQPPRATQEDKSRTENVTVMDVDEKSSASGGALLPCRDSVKASRESRTSLRLHPCERDGNQLSEKETRACQRAGSASRLSEVTQDDTEMSGNDACVSQERPLKQHTVEAQPLGKAPSDGHAPSGDTQTASLNGGLQTASDKVTRDSLDHSRGSNEIPTIPFTDLQMSPLRRPGGEESSRGCDVSPDSHQSRVDRTIKDAEGTEMQVSEKRQGEEEGELVTLSGTIAPNEMRNDTVEMEIENAADKDREVVNVDAANEESEKNEYNKSKLRMEVEIDHASPLQKNTPENTSMSKVQTENFQEVTQLETKIISIAELLRLQIKALDSTLSKSGAGTLARADGVRGELKANDDRKLEEEKSQPVTKVEDMPRNLKETLMEVYRLLNEMELEQIQSQAPTSAPVQALEKPAVIPPISVVGTDTTTESTRLQSSAKKPSEETPAANLVSTCEESMTLPTRDQDSSIPVLDHTEDEAVPDKDTGFNEKISPEIKLNIPAESGTIETHLDSPETEEHDPGSNYLQTGRELLELGTEKQANSLELQQDISTVKELPKNDALTKPVLETSPVLKKKNGNSSIPAATARELASGARRKIMIPKAKGEEAAEDTSPVDNEIQKKETSASPVTPSPSPSLARRSPRLQPPTERSSPAERISPLMSRRKMTAETLTPNQPPPEEIHAIRAEGKPAEKVKHDPFKAPQVIRKIRAETFADTSGHLKLWCQFFNVLSDSTIKWYRNEEEIGQIKRNAGDESQVNLAIVQASSKDSGVYRCTITNDYGTDSTDCLLSTEILGGMSLREDLGVGEEIEMTPMIFSKGVADSGSWANRFFGRIMMQESHIGDGCSHKVWRAKVIYGLEPVFESGNTCIVKTRSPISYGGKGESLLLDRNLETVKQECRIQNLAREYCKIFSAEARAIENFGPTLEVIPVYLMYRPANTVPYATVEVDLRGVYQKYRVLDHTRTGSDVEQKCCALEHWIFQWTNGNLLLTQLEGFDTKITNVGISVKSTGHQGLSIEGNPILFEQFVSQHQCNYFCGLLSLRSLKARDSLSTPTKPKGSKSPLLQRKMAASSSSPQAGRKTGGSPRLPRKSEQEGGSTPTKQKAADAATIAKME